MRQIFWKGGSAKKEKKSRAISHIHKIEITIEIVDTQKTATSDLFL